MTDDDGLTAAIERARAEAETSTDPFLWRRLHALVAIRRAESDAALLAALTETGPTDDIPPWSQISAE
jgi:hypothetical protein